MKDLAILNQAQWQTFSDLFEESLKDAKLAAVIFNNTLTVPQAEERLKVLKEYHESAVGEPEIFTGAI